MFLLLLYASATLIAGEEHEIVYPRMIVGRSGEKRVLFKAFDQDFHLRLEPTDVLADEFVLITKDEKGEEVFLKPNIEHWRNRVLQDRTVGSTIAVDDDGPLQIKGIINEELRIEPALDHVDSNGEENIANGREGFMKEVPHRVIKIDPRVNEGGYFDEVIPPGEKPIDTNLTHAEGRQGKETKVEVAFVLDRTHAAKSGSYKNSMTYMIILTNCVNLRYQTMPKVRVVFEIVAIKINSSPLDEPYIVNNMHDGRVLSDRVLPDFATYCVKKNLFPTADLIHLVLSLPMGDENDSSSVVLGIAYVGGCCDKYYKFGVSQDDGCRFDGCSTVAHELCHNCGCPHDGDGPVSYLKGSPGAADCPWDDGYIMSYVEKDNRQYQFSKCSEQSVAYLITIASCMSTKNVNSTVSTNDSRLPGKYATDELGLADPSSYYKQRCKERKSDLQLLRLPKESCYYSCRTPTQNGSYYYWNIPCLDGEWCSTGGKVCKNGICC